MKSKVRALPVLQAKDLKRARTFYEDKLGFCPDQEGPDGGVMLRADDSSIYLYETSTGPGESTVLSLDAEDFDNAIEEIRNQGVRFEEYDLPGMKTKDGIVDMDGMRAVWFKDPEGNVINVTEWKKAKSSASKAA
ncbi:MAG TPA: VOC family protein [Thermoleophilia bacterium]|nr:VOC family protein [Thermoleophilia bacterium]